MKNELLGRGFFGALVLALAINLAGTPRGHAQCSFAPIESHQVSAQKSKCYYKQFCDVPPNTIPGWYLQSITTVNNAMPNHDFTASIGSYESISTADRHTCLLKETEEAHYWQASYGIVVKEDGYIDSSGNRSGQDYNSAGGTYPDDGQAAIDVYDWFGDDSEHGGVWTSNCSPTLMTFDFNDPDGNSWHGQNALSVEYTDQMLREDIINLLPSYPSTWTDGTGIAFYLLSPDHSSGQAGKMQYRFFLCGGDTSQQGVQFRLDWQEITIFPTTTNPPSITKMHEILTGNGDPNGMYSLVHDVGVPQKECFITETGASVTRISVGNPGAPGNGGYHN